MKSNAQSLIMVSLLLMVAACSPYSAGVCAGTGGGGVLVTWTDEFVYDGPNAAYSQNRRSLILFKKRQYEEAATAFQETLTAYPRNTDALYFLGLSLIASGERNKGFNLLSRFRDPLRFRLSSEIRWWANYLSKKPELETQQILTTMRRIRAEAYQETIREKHEDFFDFP